MKIYPHLTAMSRCKPSSVALRTVELAKELNAKSILDFGCGKGRDLEFYNQQGYKTFGYDAHAGFNALELPDKICDLAVSAFVLNVIPTEAERLNAIESMLFAAKYALVAVRSSKDIEQEKKKNWQLFNDGYVTPKNTFQKGFSQNELVQLASKVKNAKTISYKLNFNSQVAYILMENEK